MVPPGPRAVEATPNSLGSEGSNREGGGCLDQRRCLAKCCLTRSRLRVHPALVKDPQQFREPEEHLDGLDDEPRWATRSEVQEGLPEAKVKGMERWTAARGPKQEPAEAAPGCRNFGLRLLVLGLWIRRQHGRNP
jgi:hypothetical protein